MHRMEFEAVTRVKGVMKSPWQTEMAQTASRRRRKMNFPPFSELARRIEPRLPSFLPFGNHGERGLDLNPTALKIGQIAYGLPEKRVFNADIIDFSDSCGSTYDVVILLSVLHHFIVNPELGSPEELLKRTDGITGNVLFFDTGQAHEERYCNILSEWSNDVIVDFILQHSTFDHVIALGSDSDDVTSKSRMYGRTLFACVRS